MTQAEREDNQSEQMADKGRTRRNVIAMAGLLGSALIVATAGSTSVANAQGAKNKGKGRPSRPGKGGGGNSGGYCLLSGTKVRTVAGEVEVEKLRVGDRVLTITGEERPVRRMESWRADRMPGKNWPASVAPIKVCQSALAPNVPSRDLYLSPGHALFVDGVLMRAGALVNGHTIVRCSDYEANKLEYFHIELDDHQVILAEGAPVESFLADGMVSYAPIGIIGIKAEFASRFRSAISPWYDRRHQFDKVRDRLDARAQVRLAA